MGEAGPKGPLVEVIAEHAANGNGLRLTGEGSPGVAGSLGTGARLEAKIRALAAKLKQSKVGPCAVRMRVLLDLSRKEGSPPSMSP